MIILVWNARGLGGPRAFLELQCLVHEVTPDLLFISECRILNYRINHFKYYLNFDCCFYVSPVGSKGGLALFWNANANVNILSYSCGHIDSLVAYYPTPFYFTGFYGNPEHNLRYLSWQLLHKISGSHSNSKLGWFVGGDFNEILYDFDKVGGKPRAFPLINNFCNTLAELELSSLRAMGPHHT